MAMPKQNEPALVKNHSGGVNQEKYIHQLIADVY